MMVFINIACCLYWSYLDEHSQFDESTHTGANEEDCRSNI